MMWNAVAVAFWSVHSRYCSQLQGHLNQEEAGYCIVMEVLAILVCSREWMSELCRAINAAGQKQTPRYVDWVKTSKSEWTERVTIEQRRLWNSHANDGRGLCTELKDLQCAAMRNMTSLTSFCQSCRCSDCVEKQSALLLTFVCMTMTILPSLSSSIAEVISYQLSFAAVFGSGMGSPYWFGLGCVHGACMKACWVDMKIWLKITSDLC